MTTVTAALQPCGNQNVGAADHLPQVRHRATGGGGGAQSGERETENGMKIEVDTKSEFETET